MDWASVVSHGIDSVDSWIATETRTAAPANQNDVQLAVLQSQIAQAKSSQTNMLLVAAAAGAAVYLLTR